MRPVAHTHAIHLRAILPCDPQRAVSENDLNVRRGASLPAPMMVAVIAAVEPDCRGGIIVSRPTIVRTTAVWNGNAACKTDHGYGGDDETFHVSLLYL